MDLNRCCIEIKRNHFSKVFKTNFFDFWNWNRNGPPLRICWNKRKKNIFSKIVMVPPYDFVGEKNKITMIFVCFWFYGNWYSRNWIFAKKKLRTSPPSFLDVESTLTKFCRKYITLDIALACQRYLCQKIPFRREV